ncbi:transglutaminase family protein [Andreprevotia chitinilytica]|uniref:transglutaminase family protein n=1 Tax=Andreprevotia chitinilytica TaxID=396808 RepID=UPI0005559AE2|nr:transglutaminase family protein [Andreprevotia chitinilytica]
MPTQLYVAHETTYHYASRVDLAQHLAWLEPVSQPWQQLESCALTITPEPAYLSRVTDYFGNTQHRFSITAPHDALCVKAESVVSLSPRFTNVDPAASPAWEAVRAAMHFQVGMPFAPESEFAYPSPFVPLLRQLHDYALASFMPERPLLDAVLELMHRIHREFTYAAASTEVSTPVLEAFNARMGVCQDFAHIMIGCLRALGLPARYVSGYLLTDPPPGQPRLLGADASHAWLSVWCPVHGWVDLDPTNDVVPTCAHVVVAVGRDYGDVTPLRGVIQGGRDHTLDVAVSVLPLGGV